MGVDEPGPGLVSTDVIPPVANDCISFLMDCKTRELAIIIVAVINPRDAVRILVTLIVVKFLWSFQKGFPSIGGGPVPFL